MIELVTRLAISGRDFHCPEGAGFRSVAIMKDLEFDVVILGGGSAGYAAARTVAAGGLRTAVVEGGEEVGGLCILRGCMPTKALLQAADVMHLVHRAPTWGIHPHSVTFDFQQVMARKGRLISDFASYRSQQLQDGRFTFLRGSARFVDANTLELSGTPSRRITARSFVIATGSKMAEPPLLALKRAGYITSDEALQLTQLPKSMVVLGGGAVAVEFAQFFQRFGTRVTLIQRSEQLLKDFDPDAHETLSTVLRREGMQVHTGTSLVDAGVTATGKFVEFEQGGVRHRVEADEIFNALGRSPNTAELNLEAAGVRTQRGRIVTDDRMQTSAAHIYAAGDCSGPYEVVHLAVIQGEVAGRQILQPGSEHRMDYRLLTVVVFTDPQIACVGLTEREARSRGVEVRVASHPFNDHGKSMIMEALDGFVKLIADPRTGEILGGACVGPMGGELIHEIVVAMDRRMTVHALAAVPHYHPTLAEIWTYPAEELASQIPLP